MNAKSVILSTTFARAVALQLTTAALISLLEQKIQKAGNTNEEVKRFFKVHVGGYREEEVFCEPRTPIQTQYVSLAALLPRAIVSVVILALMLIASIGFTPQAHAQVMPGDTLVIDSDAGTGGNGALFRVNPANGSRTVVSDFGNSAQGPLGRQPYGVALDSSGNILVVDLGAGTGSDGALFRVNPATGNRTLVSDFGDTNQGPLGVNLLGVALESSGNILVLDQSGGTNFNGRLFRVDPNDGKRTVVSDFGNSAQGASGSGSSLIGVALDASGNILVVDFNGGMNLRGALCRVNPTSGYRTIVSDFGNSAQDALGSDPSGVALDASGDILVVDISAGMNFRGALYRVNPTSGNRTIVSDFGNSAQGALGSQPSGVALDASGNILVMDDELGTGRGALFRVNPTSGNRTVVSDFDNSAQGPLGASLNGVAILPPQPRLGDILVVDPEAGVSGSGALFSVDLFNGSRSLISNFGMSVQGMLGWSPFGVAVDSSGNILVIDPGVGTARGALSRVNPTSGNRTLLSDFANSVQGPFGEEPIGVAVDSSGSILVTDPFAGTSGRGLLFRVNPTTGNRTVLSDFGNSSQGTLGFDPYGVVVDASGNILVIDLDAGTNGRGALFRVNPSTGSRTVLSDFGNNAQGTLGNNPTGVALGSSGTILVIDQTAGTSFSGTLFGVNPSNGNRTVISDFGNMAQGPLGLNPTGVALHFSGMILVIDPNTGSNFSGVLFGVDPSGGNRVLISDFGDPSKGLAGVDPSGVSVFTVKCGGLDATRIGNSFDNTING
ncbi:MAG: hypothetical protein ACHBNF_01020, partial [Chromatiales bacterium]